MTLPLLLSWLGIRFEMQWLHPAEHFNQSSLGPKVECETNAGSPAATVVIIEGVKDEEQDWW